MSNPDRSEDALSCEEIHSIAESFHMELEEDEISVFQAAIDDALPPLERLVSGEEHSQDCALTKYQSDIRETDVEPVTDPHNAVVSRCRIENDDGGPLAGYEVGLKDSIAVADVEMTVGSDLFRGYIPTYDATVVSRLLDAGATITGKLNMDELAFSASGEVALNGPVHNPNNRSYLAGGSSGGSAAAVVAGEVDLALGTDQGGSIRIPASWCGCVGHKPTFGLVPYTGIVGAGFTFDHVGPLARSVKECALALDVLAGADGIDPRQQNIATQCYANNETVKTSDIRIALVQEGVGLATDEVVETVQAKLDQLADNGATVDKISIPYHRDGLAIWSGILLGEAIALFETEGVGTFHRTHYDSGFAAKFGQIRRDRADELPSALKLSLILGRYLASEHPDYHVIAQNLRTKLREAYDEVLSSYDVLAMPTTTCLPHPVLDQPSLAEQLRRGEDMLENTAPFNATGHPALSVPCGDVDGLPVGLMLVGKLFDDSTVLNVGRVVEE